MWGLKVGDQARGDSYSSFISLTLAHPTSRAASPLFCGCAVQ